MSRHASRFPRQLKQVVTLFQEPSVEVRTFARWMMARTAEHPQLTGRSLTAALVVWDALRRDRLDAELRLGSGRPYLQVLSKRYSWLHCCVIALEPPPASSCLQEQVIPAKMLTEVDVHLDLAIVTQADCQQDGQYPELVGILGWAMPHLKESTPWEKARQNRAPLPVTELYQWSDLIVYCSRTFGR